MCAKELQTASLDQGKIQFDCGRYVPLRLKGEGKMLTSESCLRAQSGQTLLLMDGVALAGITACDGELRPPTRLKDAPPQYVCLFDFPLLKRLESEILLQSEH